MELEVRAMPRIHDCFAAIPLHLMEALQRSATLLTKAVLELRDRKDTSRRWHVAWGGACSASPFIEVSDKLALCISLPNRALVSIRALREVPIAESAQLEPASEDDWEILELNAEFVEAQVLSQVGALSPGQHFPLWIHGSHTSLTFRVLSTSPHSPVVQLVPGTQLIVAPKQRKIPALVPADDVITSAHSPAAKAWLRVQEFDHFLAHTVDFGVVSSTVFPTTAIFVSPITAQAVPFTNGCIVILTSSKKAKLALDPPRENEQISDRGKEHRMDDATNRLVVLRLVHCNLIAKGHVMMANSIRLLVGARIHSRVLVKACKNQPGLLKSLMVVSPMKFKYNEGKSAFDYGELSFKQKENTQKTEWLPEDYDLIWREHLQLVGVTKTEITSSKFKDSEYVKNFIKEQVGSFIKIWLAAQLAAVANCLPGQCDSVPITSEVVIEFQLFNDLRSGSSNGSRITGSLVQSHRKQPLDALFLLRVCDQITSDRSATMSSKLVHLKLPSYFLLKKDSVINGNLQQSEGKQFDSNVPGMVNAVLGEPCYLSSLLAREVKDTKGVHVASLTWLEVAASEAFTRLKVLLSPEAREKAKQLHIPSPGFLLLYGPPACGKTKLALTLASRLQRDPSILAHKIFVKCAELVGEQAQTIRAAFQNAISEALEHAPSLVILDDLDKVIPSSTLENSEPSVTSLAIAEFLADLLDLSQVYGTRKVLSPIAFLAVAQAISALPTCLCSSGRFDFHIALSPPATKGRTEIISQELIQRNVTCQPDIIAEIAAMCDGYDTTDLELLVDRAVHAAITRFFPSSAPKSKFLTQQKIALNLDQHPKISDEEHEQKEHTAEYLEEKVMELLKDDFSEALKGFSPVAMRGLTKASSQSEHLGWEDVGGLSEVCQALKETLELPVKYSKIFAQAPLRLRTGVLLYGPPGCGKTYIVGVAAAACSLRFISVKGPELLNKYIGASEQAVRDVFGKANAAAPCILFFDEFDAIAPKRGHDNTGVTDRVVNQLLTELDGVEALNGVFVFAATSRPDLLDVALLRPGRLDRLLFCDFPSLSERLEILKVHSRKLSLGKDVTLDGIATLTEGYSAADLRSLLYDAELEAVERALASSGSSAGGRPPITMEILREVVLKSKPSVSEKEKQRLHQIYNSFLSARSISNRARDVKGKRATLA